MVLQGCAKIVLSCTWNGFPILPFCEFPIALHGFVHIQHIHITACLRSSMQVSKESQIHLVQASPNLGSGGSGYWSLLLVPICPAKAHLHMLKALLGYSSWRCTSSTRLSRPLREKSDCSVVVSSLCQSMLQVLAIGIHQMWSSDGTADSGILALQVTEQAVETRWQNRGICSKYTHVWSSYLYNVDIISSFQTSCPFWFWYLHCCTLWPTGAPSLSWLHGSSTILVYAWPQCIPASQAHVGRVLSAWATPSLPHW